jgi:hypothetical protein
MASTAVMALAAALMVLIGPSPASGQAQDPQATAPAPGGQDMMAMRKNMMAMREKMMAEAKAGDARLQTLLDQMNAAAGNAKMDAMATLLAELTAQHRAGQQRMGQMMPGMMMEMMGMMEGMNSNMQNMMRGRGAGSPPAR